MWKTFKLLTYPLSYNSLQEEPVTENTTHIKHSLQKRYTDTEEAMRPVTSSLPGGGCSDIEMFSTRE